MIFRRKFKNIYTSNHETEKIPNLDVKSKDLERLLFSIIIVKKGHGLAIIDLLMNNGIAMCNSLYGEGTKERYVMDILGGEEKNKECVLALIPKSKYNNIKVALKERFKISAASSGILLTFNVDAMAGVLAYKFLTDFKGALKYGK